jgi:hypothetical protein
MTRSLLVAVVCGTLGAVAVALLAVGGLHVSATGSNVSAAKASRIVHAEYARWRVADCPMGTSCPEPLQQAVDNSVASRDMRAAAAQQDRMLRSMLKPMCAQDITKPGQLNQQQLRSLCHEWHLPPPPRDGR